MATVNIANNRTPDITSTLPGPQPTSPADSVLPLSANSTTVSIKHDLNVPFQAIQSLFDHLHAHPDNAAQLNAIYPRRGILKTAATHNKTSDQKFTLDLSPSRNTLIPPSLRNTLAAHGFEDILAFFTTLQTTYVPTILSSLSVLAGTDLQPAHKNLTMNFRLCDYNPATAAPHSDNGCGAHTDYGPFSIIFQDGTPGLELEDADAPGTWVPVPGDATVILTGWCAVILSGGRIRAARHRVRRVPGVRRFSAVLFVAPDLDVKLKPLDGVEPARMFAEGVMRGEMDVETFKEVMGKRWRYREGTEVLVDGDGSAAQDSEIEKLVWGRVDVGVQAELSARGLS